MNKNIKIDYLVDDPEVVSALAGWIYDEWGHMVPGRTLDTAHEKVRQTVVSKKVPLTLVCYADGKPVGTASIDTEDMDTHPELTPWMASVYVDPNMRKMGIGTALCERTKEELKRLGVATAYLFTPDQEKLYEKMGWKTFLREYYRDEEVVIMKIDIK
jgi:N-acetylglutamate synthase-like GNAT family acetyltransferase